MAEQPFNISSSPPSTKSFRPGWLAAAGVWTIAIGVLSLLPSHRLPLFPGADKLFHAAFYLVLGFCWVSSRIAPTPRSIRTFVILIAGYGLLLEIGQRYVPGRSYDLLDAVANAGGAILGAVIPYFRSQRLSIPGKSRPDPPG